MNETKTERNLGGRPRTETSQEQFNEAVRRFRAGELTMAAAAASCGLGRTTFYSRIKEGETRKSFGDFLKDGDVSSLNTEQLQMIPIEKLQPDPNNFYSMTGIEELAESIEFIGLQQPLRVRPEGEQFVIVSGHRRLSAIQLIRETEPSAFADGVPCLIDGAASPLMQELRLIYANSSTRVLSAAEMSRQAERVEDILYQLQEQGIEFPGRMRDHVAAACKASASRIARLHAIRKNLSTPLQPYFEDGELPEGLAYRLSQLPRPLQTEIQMKLGRAVCGLTGSQLETVIDQTVKAKEDPEPETRPEAAVDVSSLNTEVDAREIVSGYMEQRAEEDMQYFSMLMFHANTMIMDLASRAPEWDITRLRPDGIEALKQRWRHAGSYGMKVERTGTGKGLELCSQDKKTKIERTWTDVYDMLCYAALQLAAQEPEKPEAEPNPEPAWQTGIPPRPGRYFCRVDMETTKPIENRCDWDGNEWSVYGIKLQDKWQVVSWWPLPKQEG